MSTEPGADVFHLAEPDVELGRRMAVAAHQVVIVLQETGLPEHLTNDLAAVSTDLGGLWAAHRALDSHLETLFESKGDWEAIADCLVDLGSSIEHMSWHLKNVRRPLGRISRYAYGAAQEGSGGCEDGIDA